MKLKAVRGKRRIWWRRRAALLVSLMLLSWYIHVDEMIEASGSVIRSGHERAWGQASAAVHAVVEMDVGGREQAWISGRTDQAGYDFAEGSESASDQTMMGMSVGSRGPDWIDGKPVDAGYHFARESESVAYHEVMEMNVGSRGPDWVDGKPVDAGHGHARELALEDRGDIAYNPGHAQLAARHRQAVVEPGKDGPGFAVAEIREAVEKSTGDVARSRRAVEVVYARAQEPVTRNSEDGTGLAFAGKRVDVGGSAGEVARSGRAVEVVYASVQETVARNRDDAEKQAGSGASVQEQKEIYRRLAAGESVTGDSDRSYRVPDKPTVYLTFDDGPSTLTPRVLDILAEEKVRATFFVLGSLVERYPDTVKRIVEEGHAIGNHSYDHEYERLYTNFSSFFEQVTQTDDAIWRTTGIRTRLFRAPGGTYRHFDPFYSYYMDQAGYLVYDWDVDSGDSRRKGVPASEIIANVQGAPLKHQLIVLFHDGSGHEETVQALREIIRYYKRLGYQFAALDASVEPRRFTPGTLKWKRTTSWQDHVRNMELVATVREMREEAYEASTDEERLMLVVNGRRYEWGSEDFYVLDGHFQVKLARIVEALGPEIGRAAASRWYASGRVYGPGDVRMRSVPVADAGLHSLLMPANDRIGRAGCCANLASGTHAGGLAYEQGVFGIWSGFVSGAGLHSLLMPANDRTGRAGCCANLASGTHAGGLAYEQGVFGIRSVPVADARLHSLLAMVTVRDGELYLPLRRTVELLGGSIPAYDLSRAVKEVQVRI